MHAGSLLLWDQHFLIVLMRNTEGFSFGFQLFAAVNVRPWRRIFLHVAFHPRWVLPLSSEAETCALGGVGLEAAVKTVGRLSSVLRVVVESIGLGHAVGHDSFLQGACALLIEDA